MTTHRFIQIHNLINTCQAEAACAVRAAHNALSINNKTAYRAFMRRASRLHHIAHKAQEAAA